MGWMAWGSGSPRLSLVASALVALLVLEISLGSINLRGLRIERRIEGEIFAGDRVSGSFSIENKGKLWSCWSLMIRECDREEVQGAGEQASRRIGSGQKLEISASWIFRHRGERRLKRILVESRWPFGLVTRRRVLELSDRVLVYPAIGEWAPTRMVGGHQRRRASLQGVGVQEGFQGLREYQPGDSLRWIHWPTSARTGLPMVVLRPDHRSDAVMVLVDSEGAEGWEAALSGAVAQVLSYLGSGRAVGLTLAGVEHPPRRGSAWRRYLLAELARSEEPLTSSST
jgi:uncharacterized protein (DUF58 family)